MKTYKLIGIKKCDACDGNADYYIDGIEVCLCKKCALELYKSFGEHFVPKAIPNVVLRSEKLSVIKQNDELSADANELRTHSEKSDGITVKTRRNKWQNLKKKSSRKS